MIYVFETKENSKSINLSEKSFVYLPCINDRVLKCKLSYYLNTILYQSTSMRGQYRCQKRRCWRFQKLQLKNCSRTEKLIQEIGFKGVQLIIFNLFLLKTNIYLQNISSTMFGSLLCFGYSSYFLA